METEAYAASSGERKKIERLFGEAKSILSMVRLRLDAETPTASPDHTPSSVTDAGGAAGVSDPTQSEATGEAPGAAVAPGPRRFHGTVRLDPSRVGRDASRIADEVIAHLVGQMGAEVTVTIEIEASLQDGASDQIVRTVTENSRTLKFTSHGFESE